MKMHVWRYDATEPYRPWIVSHPDAASDPPAFQTWVEAQSYAVDFARGLIERRWGYQPPKQ